MNGTTNRRGFLKAVGLGVASLAVPRPAFAQQKRRRKPNFIIFFTDDQGYNDVGCFGSPLIRTPRFDRMAGEGMKFTSFYAQAVCGPSRAALMTGCYPIRVAEPGNRKHQHTILHRREITMAEVLKDAGYATACIGKWHLAGGRKSTYNPQLMPNAQGFECFYGTPLHNGYTRTVQARSFKTQLMRNDEILDDFLDRGQMNSLTRNYTSEAIAFIRKNKDRPFFLYLSHNMPHVPLGASEKFRGRSKRGMYGDVIEELDWSAGVVIDTLKELGLDEHTLVVFTSDNGPWIEKHIGDYGGSADPLRGSKMMTWDGGLRVPCIVHWPGRIPAGKVCDEVVTTMDLLPTFAGLAGAKLPDDRVIDGKDIWPLMSGQRGATSPHEAFYFYCFTHLQAVRSGKWKLVRPRPARPPWAGWSARMIDAVPTTQLYDLEADIEEKHNVADQRPDVVARLMKLVERARQELGDYDRIGRGARFFDKPIPRSPEERDGRRRRRRVEIDYDHPAPVGNLRFDFEAGDLQGWRVVEGSFEAVVNDRERFHHLAGGARYNKQGRYFLTTLERAAGGRGNDKQTGVIESPVFTLKGSRMSFLVGGGRHRNTYIALCDLKSGKELLKASGVNGEAMQRVNWDVGRFKGRKLFLRIVDKSTSGWGHVTFDDFSAEGEIDSAATARRWKRKAK